MKRKKSKLKKATSAAGVTLLGLFAAVLVYSFVIRLTAGRIDPHRAETASGLVGDIIQLQVLNGCGVKGLASDATVYLRRQGFDVVEAGDYGRYDVEQSVVVDRVGDLESARRVAVALGLPEDRIRTEQKPELYVDATVVLGADYRKLAFFDADIE